jgi:oligopeptide/dipeptide ABC transporter ATP-binding protein
MVPAIDNMPDGCRFAPRCPFAGPRCDIAPPLAELGPAHRAACHYAPLESAFAEAAG